jgi:hypothetical protein
MTLDCQYGAPRRGDRGRQTGYSRLRRKKGDPGYGVQGRPNPTHYEKADGVKFGHRPARRRQTDLHSGRERMDYAKSCLKGELTGWANLPTVRGMVVARAG